MERIDLIEKRGKVWDANQGKAQIAHAELTTSVEESLTKELQVVDRRVREYVRQLEYQTQELAGKVERLGLEVASSRALLAPRSTEDRTTHQTAPEPRMSTPMPTQRAGKAWTEGVLSEGLTVRNASTTRDTNLIRKPNMYDGQSHGRRIMLNFT